MRIVLLTLCMLTTVALAPQASAICAEVEPNPEWEPQSGISIGPDGSVHIYPGKLTDAAYVYVGPC